MFTLTSTPSGISILSQSSQKTSSRAIDSTLNLAQKSPAPQFGMASDDDSPGETRRFRRSNDEVERIKRLAARYYSSVPSNKELTKKVNDEYFTANGMPLSRRVNTPDIAAWRS